MVFRLILFLFSIALLIFIIFQKKIRKWKKAGLILVAIALVIFTGFKYVIPFNSPPDPSGDMTVLTDTVFYRYNSDIPEMLTHGNEREIPVKFWYPQDVQEGKLPLLMFSPGSFGTVDSNATLFLELASRGYIVMSLGHPYHSFTCEMSDGSSIGMDFDFINSVMASQGSEDVEGTLISLREWTRVRIDDINIVLDRVLDSNKDNDYEQYIDTKRIVLSGHSLGGSAALAIGRQRSEEIRALVILESPFVGDMTRTDGDRFVFTDKEYPLPILHVYSDSLFSKLDEVTTYEMNARLMKSDNPMYVNKHIEGVGHIGLTDMTLVSPLITNLLDRGLNKRHPPETMFELNRYVLDFLAEYNE
ncbi:MAG: hypothetical protein GX633_06120 [Clostridiales bacterium]|nr:hypothetical protein [Clostridiales bacterium]